MASARAPYCPTRVFPPAVGEYGTSVRRSFWSTSGTAACNCPLSAASSASARNRGTPRDSLPIDRHDDGRPVELQTLSSARSQLTDEWNPDIGAFPEHRA